MNDEIIAEVRAVKDAVSAQHNGDFRSLFAAIKRGEAELLARGIRVIPPPSNPASLPSTALQRSRAGRRKH